MGSPDFTQAPILGPFAQAMGMESPGDQQARQGFAQAYEAYSQARPDNQVARMNALRQASGAMQGTQNAMYQMYGPDSTVNGNDLYGYIQGHSTAKDSEYGWGNDTQNGRGGPPRQDPRSSYDVAWDVEQGGDNRGANGPDWAWEGGYRTGGPQGFEENDAADHFNASAGQGGPNGSGGGTGPMGKPSGAWTDPTSGKTYHQDVNGNWTEDTFDIGAL